MPEPSDHPGQVSARKRTSEAHELRDLRALTDEQIQTVLKKHLSYDPITVSIDGHPEITRTYRTDSDAQRVLTEMTAAVRELLKPPLPPGTVEVDGVLYDAELMDNYTKAMYMQRSRAIDMPDEQWERDKLKFPGSVASCQEDVINFHGEELER